MNWQSNFVGALTLKHQIFAALRERSDVFLRGFLVLLIAALVAGVFASLNVTVREFQPPPSKEEITQQVLDNFRSRYRGSEQLRATIEPYIREGVSMVYEIRRLPPRAGEGARPVAAILNYVGSVLATPFTWMWIGWTLFAGLLFHFASRLLGGRATIAQMLGLTALAAAPQIFSALTSLLELIASGGGAAVVGAVNSLLGFVIGIWSAIIYVKATSVAQDFSIARAIGAIALGFLLLFLVFLLAIILFAMVIGLLLVPVARQFS